MPDSVPASVPMSRESIVYVLAAGALSGALYLSLSHLGLMAMVLAYFSSLPLLVIGLGHGASPATLAIAVGLLLVGAADGLFAGGAYLLSNGLPSGLLARQLLRSRTAGEEVEWYPLGHALMWLSALACAYVVAAFVIFIGSEGGLLGQIEAVLRTAMGIVVEDTGGAEGGAFIAASARTLPVIVAASCSIMSVVNAVVAQGVLVRLGRNRRPSPSFRDITLPRALVFPLAIAVVVALFPGTPGFLGTTLAAILAIPYFFLGLAVIHTISDGWPLRRAGLGVLYVVTILAGWPAALVIVLGVAEQWFGVRTRLAS